nr:NSP [Wuhan arthropod virus 2]
MFTPSMEHNLNITDESIFKIKEMLSESQAVFLDGLQETIMTSGRKLFSLFAIAATVSLLSRAIVGIGMSMVLKILHMIYCFVCGRDEFDNINKSYAVSQSGSDISIPFIPSLILNHIISPPADIINKIWKSSSIDLIMRRIGYLGDMKIDRGLEKMVDWTKEVIRKLQVWYGKDILGIYFGIHGLFDKEESPLTLWFMEVDKMVLEYYDNNFMWTEMEFQVVYSLYKQGLGLVKSPEFGKYKNEIWNILRQLTNIMEKFKIRGISNQNIRNPPVTIYLYGGTGVGKSSMTYPLAVEILKRIQEREGSSLDLKNNWKNMIYMRAPEQEFWDGYENQLVTIFDDFSQLTDSLQNPNLELFEIIRASNCFPYPLHMASLDQKSNTVFSSKIIIASSNLQSPQNASLNFPDALKRRFDECIKVDRKYTGHTDKFDPTLYSLETYDMMTGTQKGTISYSELVDKCVDAYFGRKNFVGSVEKYIDTVLNASVEVATSQAGDVPETSKDEEEERRKYQETLKRNFLKYNVRFTKNPERVGLQTYDLDFGDNHSPFAIISWLLDEHVKPRYENIKERWITFKNKHSYLSNSLMAIGVILTGLGFLKVFFSFRNIFKQQKMITEKEFVARCPRSGRAEAYSGVIVPKAKVESYTPQQVKVVKSEGVKDINAAEILMKIARTNLYKMYESTCGVAIGHVFFLKGKIALMPKHYLSGLSQALRNDPEAYVYFDAVLLNRSFEIKIRDLLATKIDIESPDEENGPVFTKDLMALVVKTSIHHSDASGYFVTRKNMSRTDATEVMLPVLVKNNLNNSDRSCMLIRYATGRSQLTVTETLPVSDDNDVVTRYIRNAYMYNLDTQDTECGTPLIVRNTLIQPGKICGIHIAGMSGTGQGWATPVYEEDVLSILSKFEEKDLTTMKVRLPLEEYPKEQGKIPRESEFLRLGKLKQGISQASKSKIVPSPIFNKITTPKTKPCVLNKVTVDGKEFIPAEYRLKRLGNIPQVVDEILIENSKSALADEMSSVFSKMSDNFNSNSKAVYTFEEACLGIEGEPYINAIKRDTSSGYPFVHMTNFTRKDIFGTAEEYSLTSPQCNYIRQRVDFIIESARNNVALDHYFIDTLKDERKPIEKAHKTRLFSAGPIDYLIACKMYFNGVVNLISKTRNACHISVGTNVYSNDWHNIVEVLHMKSKHIIAGDFEGFDASQHQRMLLAALDVLVILSKRFLSATDDDCRVMRVLGLSLVNSLHIYKDEVYQWTHSLPSGHYLTAIVNSIFVNLAFCSVWQIAFKSYTYKFARSFWRKCGIVAYGDDHLVSIPKSCLNKFNQNTMKDLMKQIGLSYTLETKDDHVEADSRKIEQVSYLKRGFQFSVDHNRYICPLELSVILEFPMWNHKCPDPRIQTIVELDKAIEELSLHYEFVWNKWWPVLNECGESLGHYTDLKEQKDVRNIALGQKEFL